MPLVDAIAHYESTMRGYANPAVAKSARNALAAGSSHKAFRAVLRARGMFR